ncbi:thymidine phosphorylase [Amycolatopsis nivea]
MTPADALPPAEAASDPVAVDVIRTKRDGGRLSDEQIDWVVDAYTHGVVAEEQMAALAMAIFLRGMDDGEIARWTGAMIDSGSRLSLDVARPTVDKHSTGGVGDKITLPLAPLVAACGAAVPQLSGRGLGHTGGTLDKLEAIPGWRAALSLDEIAAQLNSVGAVVCAATEGLAPADKKLYALRDVTSTVESVPLIASSIMSKKIAEGASGLVLDVKAGSGAFMKTVPEAQLLARTLVDIGTAHGVACTALITDMGTPLGRAVGNAVEVAEAVEVLRGGGPADVVSLTVALAREMLALAGISVDPAEVLASGEAYEVWARMISAQGGDPSAALPRPSTVHVVPAPASGVLTSLDAYAVGVAAWRLGAGRARKEDPVQAAAGILCHAKPGDQVVEGEPLLELHTDTPDAIPAALAALEGGFAVGAEAPAARGIVLETVRP